MKKLKVKKIKLSEKQFNYVKQILLEYNRILSLLEGISILLDIDINQVPELILDDNDKSILIPLEEDKENNDDNN